MGWIKSWYQGEGLLGMKARRAIWHALKLPESSWVNDILDQQDLIHNCPDRKAERAACRRRFLGMTLPLILSVSAGMSVATARWFSNVIELPAAVAAFLFLSVLFSALFWPD